MSWVSWKKLCETKTVGGMGFRDMWYFNVALLAKQAWRILTRPDLLLTRILKARYFPNDDLFSADLGSHPSATWRSICYVREYLYEGLRKRIGNGHQTSIWSEPWLANPGQCRIITKRPTHSSFPDRVSDIIDPIHHTWNENLINTFFWPVDRSRILEVPIGHMEVEDRWIWRLSKHGNFTVRSCYHNALNMEIKENKRPSKREAGRSGEAWEWWKYVWKLQIPPKIKIFLWRFCSDISPTNENLCCRKIYFSPQCMRCGVGVESALHVLLSCRDVGDIWICPPFDQLKLHSIQSHLQLFELLVTNIYKYSLNLATTVMWKCWDQRNKEMHGENSLQAVAILSWCRDYLKEHSEHQLRSSLTQPQRLPTKWKPPDDGVIKINVDASFPRVETYYATSLVARNSRGECVFWMVHKFAGRPTVVDGEAHAILRALITAKEKKWPNIIVEGDNLQVITALRDKNHSVLPFGAFIEQSLSLSRVFEYCTFDFIRRSGNKLAHMLVSIYGHSCSEGATLPSNLADIAQ